MRDWYFVIPLLPADSRARGAGRFVPAAV